MDGSGTHRVEGDQGNRPDSPVGMVGRQESHAPKVNELKTSGRRYYWYPPTVSLGIEKSSTTSCGCSSMISH